MSIKKFNLEFYQAMSLLGKDKYKGYLLSLLFLLVSILEFFGLGLIVPLISIFLESQTNSRSNIVYFFLSNNISKEIILVLFAAIFFLKYVLLLFANYLVPKFIFSIQKKIRLDLIKYFFSQKDNFIESSDLIQLTTNTLSIFSIQYMSNIFRVLSSSIMLLFILSFLLIFNFKGTFLLFLLLVLIFFFYKFYFKKKFKVIGENLINKNYRIIEISNEIFKGIDEIKVYKKYDLFIEKIKNFSSSYSQSEVSMRFLIPLPRVLLELVIILSFFLIISVSMLTDFEAPLLSLIVYAYAALRIIPSLNELITSINVARSAKKAVNTIYKYSKIKKNTDIFVKKINFKQIEGKNINFKYPSSNKINIKNLNFKIQKGEFIGIVGSSGIGKSTIMKILIGFIEPNSGSLFINNKKLKNYADNIQLISSYIPQENFILKSTIRENITLEDNKIKKYDQKIFKVLKFCGLSAKINSLNGKLDYVFKEQGKNFSGGQRQRISIARALFHDKEIFLFDESTSSLDFKSENEIFKYLASKKNITKIIISHRQNILKYCDKIILFEKDKISFKKNGK